MRPRLNLCKAALAKWMYKDTVTVKRQVEAKDDDGADCYQVEAVYENLPCKLSQYGKELAAHETDRDYRLTEDLRVCLAPEYDILPNDIVEVHHRGQTFVMYASKAFKYATHQEISVRRTESA